WEDIVSFGNISVLRDTLTYEGRYHSTQAFSIMTYTATDSTTVQGKLSAAPVSYAVYQSGLPQIQVPEGIACSRCVNCEDLADFIATFQITILSQGPDAMENFDEVEDEFIIVLTEFINNRFNYNFGYDEIYTLIDDCFDGNI